jgi:hypothetical protein
MHDDTRATYPPINTLKPVADNVWIVGGPAIRFGITIGAKRFAVSKQR